MFAWDQEKEAVKTAHKQNVGLNSMSIINT